MRGRREAIYALEALRGFMPGCEQAKLRNFGMTLGIRDTRKIDALYNLTGADVREQGRFEDAIGIFPEFIDGYGVLILPTTGRYWQVPYRALVPRGVGNLLVAGRCIGGDKISHASARNMMCCAVGGQGAGVAAGVSLRRDEAFDRLDIGAVQTELRPPGRPHPLTAPQITPATRPRVAPQASSASPSGTCRRRMRARACHCSPASRASRKRTSSAAWTAIGRPSRYSRRLPVSAASRARREDADQIERIGGRERHVLARSGLAAHIAQAAHRLRGSRIVRPRSPRRSVRRGSRRAPPGGGSIGGCRARAAANRPRARAASRKSRPSGAAACAPRARPPRRGRCASAAASRRTSAQRPASAMPNSASRLAPAAARAARARRRRHQQRPQAAETVGVHHTERHQLGKRLLGLGRQQPHAVGDVVEERCALRRDDTPATARGRGSELRGIGRLR